MEFYRFLCSVKFVVRSLGRFLGAVFACGYSGVRVAAFFEKLAHFLAFVVKVGVVTAEESSSDLIQRNTNSSEYFSTY